MHFGFSLIFASLLTGEASQDLWQATQDRTLDASALNVNSTAVYPSESTFSPSEQDPRSVPISVPDTEWVHQETNARREVQWLVNHSNPSSRLVFSIDLHMVVFLPGPPISLSGVSGFVGYELVPKFRHGKLLRRREVGYWATVALSSSPDLGLVHRHMIGLAGSRSDSQGPFMQTGMGLVHQTCCRAENQSRQDQLGFAVAAQGGWRFPSKSRQFSFFVGVPLVFEMFATPRASLGLLAGIGMI